MSNRRPTRGDRVPAAEAVVAEALMAFEAQHWSRLVELTDAGSLETLMTRYLASQRDTSIPPLAVELGFLAELAEARKEWLSKRPRLGELAGITTIEEAEALSPAEFLTRFEI